MDEGLRTYREMLTAIVLQIVVFAIVGSIVTNDWFTFSVSVVIGGALAAGILGNMKKTIVIALSLDPESAKKYGRRQSLVRIALMGLMLCVSFYFREYVNPWGVLLGMFSLKLSAYLQPFVHNVYEKINNNEKEDKR